MPYGFEHPPNKANKVQMIEGKLNLNTMLYFSCKNIRVSDFIMFLLIGDFNTVILFLRSMFWNWEIEQDAVDKNGERYEEH